ncbi:MAG TPA: adenylyl-sulfate kinase [Opitutaceae bacterium]|nr:adenylyl-sulfate kinase [Opitutaceae bacterium]
MPNHNNDSSHRMFSTPPTGPAGSRATSAPKPATQATRTALLGHRGAVIWLTGLSGAGKSTLATALEQRLLTAGIVPVILDGDVLRTGLCRGLGFNETDRKENIRRAAEAALLIAESGVVVITALISPYRADRQLAAERCQARGVPFAEIYVNASLAECERRDPKHLYRRARAGEIPAFTGLTSPYEPPLAPTLELHTDRESVAQSLEQLAGLTIRLVRPETAAPSA